MIVKQVGSRRFEAALFEKIPRHLRDLNIAELPYITDQKTHQRASQRSLKKTQSASNVKDRPIIVGHDVELKVVKATVDQASALIFPRAFYGTGNVGCKRSKCGGYFQQEDLEAIEHKLLFTERTFVPWKAEQPESGQLEDSAGETSIVPSGIPALDERKGHIILGEASSDVVVASSEPVDPRKNPPPFKPAEMSLKSPDVLIDERFYIEKSKRFYKADRRELEKISSPANGVTATQLGVKEDRVQLDCAGAVQITFSLVAYALHGLLAGFSVFHCFFIFSNVQDNAMNPRFVLFYRPLAMIIHSLYFGIGAICTTAAMDRYDLYQTVELLLVGNLPCWRLFFHFGMVCVYILIMALSLSTISIDEQISTPWYNSTSVLVGEYSAHKNNQTFVVDDLVAWKYCNLARALLLCITWLLAQIGPDMLTTMLKTRRQKTLAESSGSPPVQGERKI